MNQTIKAAAVGYSCIDMYEKLNKFYPTGNNSVIISI